MITDGLVLLETINDKASRARKTNTDLRQGQALFNALKELRPDIANKIKGTSSDCSVSDKNIQAFAQIILGSK